MATQCYGLIVVTSYQQIHSFLQFVTINSYEDWPSTQRCHNISILYENWLRIFPTLSSKVSEWHENMKLAIQIIWRNQLLRYVILDSFNGKPKQTSVIIFFSQKCYIIIFGIVSLKQRFPNFYMSRVLPWLLIYEISFFVNFLITLKFIKRI